MPTWTISAPKEFQDSVKETARKLGLTYGAYLRKAHRAYLESLTSKDFEKAKKLIELQESKERLGSLRERERILLREKGYKNKNLQRILEDVQDPEIKKEIQLISKLREEEANKQLKIHEELNPVRKESNKKLEWYRQKFREAGRKSRKKSVEDKIREELKKEGRSEENIEFCLNVFKEYAKEQGMSLWEAYKELTG